MSTKKKKAPVPAPLILKKTESSKGTIEYPTLLNARGQIEVGDVFYRVQKMVAKKVTTTEGSEHLEIEAEITKSHWQKDRPL